MRALCTLALMAGTAGCIDRIGTRRLDGMTHDAMRPDVAPVMLNDEPPFRYPSELWVQRVQGNVTLRIYVDAAGLPAPDSTLVVESSGVPALDSAAIAGVPGLRFRPARLGDLPIGISLTIPVFFRHPDAPPLPGDTAVAPNTRLLPHY